MERAIDTNSKGKMMMLTLDPFPVWKVIGTSYLTGLTLANAEVATPIAIYTFKGTLVLTV
jgi:hypothetical protein